MCLIFAKSAVELLVLTGAGSNQFLRWESWALVLGLIALALLQVRLCIFSASSTSLIPAGAMVFA